MKRRVAVGLFFLLTSPALADGAATRPATTQSTTTRPAAMRLSGSSRPATTTSAPARATVAPDAKPWLAKLSAVYVIARPWHFTADMTGRFDVAGRAKDYALKIDARTDGNGPFRHDADTSGLLVSDGDHSYLYDRRRDSYAELTAAAGRVPADAVGANLLGVLVDENPALLLTLTTDPADLLGRVAKSIRVASSAATRPAGAPAVSAGLVLDQVERIQTLWLNEAGEIIASTVDYTPMMKSRGATAIKSALVTLIYRSADHDVPAAGVFTWRPPATAMQFDASDDLVQSATQPATQPAARGR